MPELITKADLAELEARLFLDINRSTWFVIVAMAGIVGLAVAALKLIP